MSTNADSIQAHLEQRAARGPVKVDDQRGLDHPNWLRRTNALLGLKITTIVGTMWAAYLFTGIALFALPSAIRQGTYFVVVWLSSSFLQLVLLPIIIVGQNIQAKAADERADATYRDADAILTEALKIQQHLETQDAQLSALIDKMAALEALMAAQQPPR
jgi:hypothetical protein